LSDIEATEEIAEQTRSGIGPRRWQGWALSPAIERAFVRREPKPAALKSPPAQRKKKAQAATPSAPATPFEISSYDDLVQALRARADHLEISRETISHLAGLPGGYAGKVLAVNGCRRIGMSSLGDLLGALCVKLVMVEDEAALKILGPRLVKRDDAHFRSAKARHDNSPPASARKRT
jgi:hypothetical protein